jgi:hypothetical protein
VKLIISDLAGPDTQIQELLTMSPGMEDIGPFRVSQWLQPIGVGIGKLTYLKMNKILIF